MITSDVSPKAYNTMVKHQTEEDGFKLIIDIITNGSPKLGGEARGLIAYESSLDYEDGEKLTDLYLILEKWNKKSKFSKIKLANFKD